MAGWRDIIGTVSSVFKIGLNKASLDASALTVPRTFALPDAAGTLALTASPAFTGNPTAPTALQFDNDTSIATTAYAMSIGFKAGNHLGYTASVTLTSAAFGQGIHFTHATVPGTITLPTPVGIAAGHVIAIANINSAPLTVTNPAGNIFAMGILSGFGTSSITLQCGDSVILYCLGNAHFSNVSGSRLTDEHSAIASGAILPNPGTAGRRIWSTTEARSLNWSGTRWTEGSPSLARNDIGYWRPHGNSTVVPGVVGYTAPTVVGTPTARNVATTNYFARTSRLGYVSAATAAAFAGSRVAVAQVTIGTGTGLGGFEKVVRFGISDAAAVAGARMFVGVSSNTAAATNVEPSTLLNSIGVGHGAADTNLKLYYGGSAAQVPIDLGVNFPTNTLSVDAYELSLFASPNNGNVSYVVTRLNTGATATGTLTAATAGTQLPLNTTLLSYHNAWRTNNATLLAVGLDVMSDYVRTDN